MDLNLIDLAIVAVMGVSLLMGFFRGVIREVLSLVVWGVAFWASIFHYQPIAEMLEFIATPAVRNVVAGSTLFFSILIIGSIFNFLVTKLFKIADLGGIDKLLGLGFGVVRGLLIIVMGISLSKFTPANEFETWHQSKLIPPVTFVTDIVKERIPESWYAEITKHLE